MDRRLIRWLAGIGIVMVGLFAGGASPGLAATEIAVDCGAGADLQAAINAAPKSAILDISGRCVGTFTVSKNLVLKGVSGAVLDAHGGSPVLSVTVGKVRATRLTVTGGLAEDTVAGIKNAGTLTLVRVTVQNNESSDSVAGIENLGTLIVQRSVVTRNLSDVTGGIGNAGTATIDHSTISNGEAGIRNTGTLMLTESTVSHAGGTQTPASTTPAPPPSSARPSPRISRSTDRAAASSTPPAPL